MSSPQHFRIERIFREVFDQPSLVVTPDLGPPSLPEWDSVAMVQLVLAIEQEFGIRFGTDEVAGIKCAGDLMAAVSSKGAS